MARMRCRSGLPAGSGKRLARQHLFPKLFPTITSKVNALRWEALMSDELFEGPPTRVVTVGYLHELYSEIAALRDEQAAIRALLETVGERSPNGDVLERLAESFQQLNEAAEDLTLEEFEALTAKQQEIVALLAQGWNQPQVARHLGVADPVVREQLGFVRRKLRRWRRRAA